MLTSIWLDMIIYRNQNLTKNSNENVLFIVASDVAVNKFKKESSQVLQRLLVWKDSKNVFKCVLVELVKAKKYVYNVDRTKRENKCFIVLEGATIRKCSF